MVEDRKGQTTRLLSAASDGNKRGLDSLFALVYEELREMARFHMAGERGSHTLQPTALVHEAYLRLVDAPHDDWENRRYFFGAAGQAMRRILVEHARRGNRLKRGGGRTHIPLDEVDVAAGNHDFDWLDLEEAMVGLGRVDPRLVEIVHLRFFAGRSVEETARVLGLSARTIKRDWRYARAFLLNHLRGETEATETGPADDG